MSQDKKTIIYEAVLSLINDNQEMHSIKVSDIAQRANIGKGTVYEYFESKEQIMAEAILYICQEGLKPLRAIIEAKLSFRDSYLKMMDAIDELLNRNKTLLRYINLNESSFPMHKTIQSIVQNEFEKIRKSYMEIYELIVDKAVEEGIIKEKPHTFDWYLAITNSVMAMMIQKEGFEEFSGITKEQALEKSYHMFIKMLS